MFCREAIKEDLKERRAEVLAEAAEAGQNIRNARRNFANSKTMTALRTPDGTIRASKKGDGKGHSRLLLGSLRQPRLLASSPSEGKWTCHSKAPPFRSPTRHHVREESYCTDPDRIKSEHLEYLPSVLIKTLTRFFTRYLSERKVPKQWKTSKTVLLYKKGDPRDIGNCRPICLLSVIYKLFTRVILNKVERTLDEGQPCGQGEFRKGFSTIDNIY
ncbi:hypothetical protein RB195_005699 [Necator americanus]|uniref:Reverse transcriptase domain-containing protein n=1 Tax=Necator americanus TaxID=51031 RepID=A0ABR1BT08_NECAM